MLIDWDNYGVSYLHNHESFSYEKELKIKAPKNSNFYEDSFL